jgi:hypothetical protein
MTNPALKPATERAIWLMLALVSAVPFLMAPLPILPDLFTHIGRYHVMTHQEDPFLSRYYAFDWHLLGNLGMDLLMAAFGPILGTERAAFLLTSLIPPLMVTGIWHFARARHGRVPATAYLAILFVWSFTFFHGFVNYWLGIALVFHVAAGWIRLTGRALWLRLSYALLASILVWLCHTSAWGVLGLLIAALEFERRKSLSRFVFSMMPWAAPMLPMLIWRATKGGGPLMDGWRPMVKLKGVANILRAEWEWFDKLSIGVLIAVLLWLLIGRRFDRDRALLNAAAALLICALALPTIVLSSYFADVRLYAPLLMIAFLAVREVPKPWAVRLAVAGVALFCVRVGETTIGWIQRGNELTVDLAALDKVPMGARIAVLGHSSECGVWSLAGRGHAPSLAIPRRHAFVNTEWDIPGQHLMRPIYNDGIGYNDSKSAELFNPAFGCPGLRVRTFLRYLPRDRFDYVWIWEAEVPPAALNWLTPVYTGPASRLYAIRKNP